MSAYVADHEWRYWRFLDVAKALANKSKDQSTKVGALILDSDLDIRSTGWNGAPRGSMADTDQRFEDRAEKLHWVAHAEANAITNAARRGHGVMGCAMVVTHAPCMGCAKLIVQSGIYLVMAPRPDAAFEARWKEDMARAQLLFNECGVRQVLV